MAAKVLTQEKKSEFHLRLKELSKTIEDLKETILDPGESRYFSKEEELGLHMRRFKDKTQQFNKIIRPFHKIN